MKICAIYNVFDGVELLKGSMLTMADHVDLFIIVYQDVSNFGEGYNPIPDMDLSPFRAVLIKYDPIGIVGFRNEINKRNIGIDYAKKAGMTHFLAVDCDEYYEDFGGLKSKYLTSGKPGSVCKIQSYFKKAEWMFDGLENYYVPFIHKLNSNTESGVKNYPFYVDPTRKVNELEVIDIGGVMHHFSYVRRNILRKINNSSARENILKSQLMADYNSPELEEHPEGYYVRDFYKKIKVVPNKFNIPCFV